MTGALVLIAVIALVLINVPIAVALGIAAVAAMLVTQGTAALPNVPLTLYQGATSFPLIAIPLFILAGAIMNTSGISQKLMDFCVALLGWMISSALTGITDCTQATETEGSDTSVSVASTSITTMPNHASTA